MIQKWLMTPERYRDYQNFGLALNVLNGYNVYQLPTSVIDRIIQDHGQLSEGNGYSWLSSILAYYGRPVSPYYVGINGVEYREKKDAEIKNNQKVSSINIYPNPNTGLFTIETLEEAKLSIYNIGAQIF